METVTYASISAQRGWSHSQKAPLPHPAQCICLSQTAIYRTGRPCLRFPLLAVMRGCNSLSVSTARSRSIPLPSLSLSLSRSPSIPSLMPLSLSLARSLPLSLHSNKRSELRQLAYKIADSIIQLHNQDKGDGGGMRGGES